MEEFEQHLNNESNKWFADTIMPIINDASMVCLKYLEKYTSGMLVGNPYSFTGRTIFYCISSADSIAHKVILDSNAPLEERARAMRVTVATARVLRQKLPSSQQITEMLSLPCVTNYDRVEILDLIRDLMTDSVVWPSVKRKAQKALNDIVHDLDISIESDLARKKDVVVAINLAKRKLRTIISRPPE